VVDNQVKPKPQQRKAFGRCGNGALREPVLHPLIHQIGTIVSYFKYLFTRALKTVFTLGKALFPIPGAWMGRESGITP
jgi:hypothetical protein